MKITDCYNCGSIQSVFYASENGYTLVKCAGCGLLYLQDRPADDQISQAHKQGKHSGLKELDTTGVFNSRKVSQYISILSDIFKQVPNQGKEWLDVGCGNGEFMVAVQDYHGGRMAIVGTEPNVQKQESARKKGLDVRYFDLESHDRKYDTISLLNVYSHLPNPPAFIRTLKGLLNPGGELILQTGDTAKFSAKDHYRPFHLPDHLSFASESIVTGILERAGFCVISINRYSATPFTLSNFAIEAAKFVLPGKISRIKFFLKPRKYSNTDMFIRARLPRV